MGRRLFVGNFSYETTEMSLRELFAQAGNVAEAKIVLDRETGRPRGFGFVEMSSDGEAQTAIERLNAREIDGRAINVSEAQERSGGGGGGARRGGGGGEAWAAAGEVAGSRSGGGPVGPVPTATRRRCQGLLRRRGREPALYSNRGAVLVPGGPREHVGLTFAVGVLHPKRRSIEGPQEGGQRGLIGHHVEDRQAAQTPDLADHATGPPAILPPFVEESRPALFSH